MTKNDDDEVWAAVYSPLGEKQAVSPRRISVAEAKRRAERERRQGEARFRRAPFPLYGLPASWEGGRFLGGGSWGSTMGRPRINSLSLVHGILVEGEGPILVIESATPDIAGGGGMLRSVAELLWRGKAKDVEEALTRLTQRWRADRALVARRRAELTPMPVRSEAVVQIDERAVAFDVLGQSQRWVGRARVGSCDVTIEGQDWPVEGLTLVQITDLEPYILGSRRFETGGAN